MSNLNLHTYNAAMAYYEKLAPATSRQRTVPGSRQMRGEATHRRVRLNETTGDVEFFFKAEKLVAYHPDNSVTIFRGDMSRTAASHHQRILPRWACYSDVGFVGAPVMSLTTDLDARSSWQTVNVYCVPAAGLRVLLGENGKKLPSIHPDSATQTFTVWTVDRKKSAALRKEHKVDDFIAWATATAAMKPDLLYHPSNRWHRIDPRSAKSGEVLRVMADPERWLEFCERYRRAAIEAARLAVIDHYDCWTSTEVPYLTGGWAGLRSWRNQCLEMARSSSRPR
jgi:hypothetical protein